MFALLLAYILLVSLADQCKQTLDGKFTCSTDSQPSLLSFINNCINISSSYFYRKHANSVPYSTFQNAWIILEWSYPVDRSESYPWRLLSVEDPSLSYWMSQLLVSLITIVHVACVYRCLLQVACARFPAYNTATCIFEPCQCCNRLAH